MDHSTQGEAKGTTFAYIIGEDAVYVGADGLAVVYVGGVQLDEFYMIIGGIQCKFVEYEGLTMVLAGTNTIFNPLVNILKAVLNKHPSDEEKMKRVKKTMKTYRDRWMSNNPGQIFACEILVIGIWNGEKCVLHLKVDVIDVVRGVNKFGVTKYGNVDAPYSIGNQFAYNHIENYLANNAEEVPLDDNTGTDLVRQAVMLSALYENSVGGVCQGKAIKYDSNGNFRLTEGNESHILYSIVQWYNTIYLQAHFEGCLVLITNGLPYDTRRESSLRQEVFPTRFRFTHHKTIVLGVTNEPETEDEEQVTIRIIRFVTPSHAETFYEAEGEKEYVNEFLYIDPANAEEEDEAYLEETYLESEKIYYRNDQGERGFFTVSLHRPKQLTFGWILSMWQTRLMY
ncbi:hypothetical protein ACHQM5_027702 [Ranunculus cassubicifolius]